MCACGCSEGSEPQGAMASDDTGVGRADPTRTDQADSNRAHGVSSSFRFLLPTRAL